MKDERAESGSESYTLLRGSEKRLTGRAGIPIATILEVHVLTQSRRDSSGTGSSGAAGPRVEVRRKAIRLVPDPTRVIARLFLPGDATRVHSILDRIYSLPEKTVAALMARLLRDYDSRHRNFVEILERHFVAIHPYLRDFPVSSDERRLLIGAYFTNEYSLESVALFNPSMVLHPDQSGVAAGSARFVMSLRACGEGHISSIEFRGGTVDADGAVTLDPVTPYASITRPVDDKLYNKARFHRKLVEMGAYNPLGDAVMERLDDPFMFTDLRRAIDAAWPGEEGYRNTYRTLTEQMLWLAHSNYQLCFPETSLLSERVIFPVSDSESRGIEDARFVRFTNDDGSVAYYATYTAYNGFRTLPQFLETTDFRNFKLYTLNGRCVQNKGMALFPRKIRDQFWMVSRLDGENIYLLPSDTVHFWNESHLLRQPTRFWEFVQIGNCGSPIETPQGWLLLTHGVGPMRQYWLGAILLDLEDPTRVIAAMEEPILAPNETERDGYVPNVVYSCGAMAHGDTLLIPYAVADTFTSIATVSLSALLGAMRRTT